MTHDPRPIRKPSPVPAGAAVPAGDEEVADILERPDGYYWQPPDGKAEFGPFETYELARARRDDVGDEPLESAETLREAESDIGMNEWIDAETGAPAEGQSPPHLEEE